MVALLCLAITVFAFKTRPFPTTPKLANTTLHFKYTAPSGDYSPAAVKDRANWTEVSPSQVCLGNINQDACSFSITVPETDESTYLSGSSPSTRVSIQTAGTSSDAYVTNLVDSTLSTPQNISSAINNQLKP